MIEKTKAWRIFQRILIILSWGFLGWLAGTLIGYYFFGDVGEKFGGLIGIVLGVLWGAKSNWLIC